MDTLAAKIAQTQVADHRRGQRHQAAVARRRRSSLIGYPKIAPEKGTCPAILPFADGDYAYLYSIEQKLNQAVENAAKAGGALYVDTFGPSTGHDACAPEGQAWIQGKDINLLRALNYHPRYEGQAGVTVTDLQETHRREGDHHSRRAGEVGRRGPRAEQKAATLQQNPAVKAAMDRLRTGAQR